jgi:antirestriction protein ArdC
VALGQVWVASLLEGVEEGVAPWVAPWVGHEIQEEGEEVVGRGVTS